MSVRDGFTDESAARRLSGATAEYETAKGRAGGRSKPGPSFGVGAGMPAARLCRHFRQRSRAKVAAISVGQFHHLQWAAVSPLEASEWVRRPSKATGATAAARASVGVGAWTRGGWAFWHH